MPERIQRQRTKGWRMPEGAIYVGRPTLWGNPWSIRDGRDVPPAERAAWAVRRYLEELTHWGLVSDWATCCADATFDAMWVAIEASGAKNMAEYAPLSTLRGHDLVCWCPLDQPCHADVLLELANA